MPARRVVGSCVGRDGFHTRAVGCQQGRGGGRHAGILSMDGEKGRGSAGDGEQPDVCFIYTDRSEDSEAAETRPAIANANITRFSRVSPYSVKGGEVYQEHNRIYP